MIKKLEKAPRRFFHTKERVGKIGEIKEILRVKIPSFLCWCFRRIFALRLKIHSLKEAHKNFILNREIGYWWFYWTFNLGQGSILRQ